MTVCCVFSLESPHDIPFSIYKKNITRNIQSTLMSKAMVFFMLQSVPQDQKSVNSLHDVISITQLLQHFKHAAEVYLTLIFLSHNISDNVQNVVYLKNLSIK